MPAACVAQLSHRHCCVVTEATPIPSVRGCEPASPRKRQLILKTRYIRTMGDILPAVSSLCYDSPHPNWEIKIISSDSPRITVFGCHFGASSAVAFADESACRERIIPYVTDTFCHRGLIHKERLIRLHQRQ